MKNMKKLRILCICDGNEFCGITSSSSSSNSNCHDGSIEYLYNDLCWFIWHEYPWKLLPKNFKPRRLVHLNLRWNSLHHLWNETKGGWEYDETIKDASQEAGVKFRYMCPGSSISTSLRSLYTPFSFW